MSSLCAHTGVLMAFLIMASSFQVHIHVPEGSLTHFLPLSAWKSSCVHSRTSLSPMGQSSAEWDEPPEAWGDAVERKGVVLKRRIPAGCQLSRKTKLGCFRRNGPACEPSAFAMASA